MLQAFANIHALPLRQFDPLSLTRNATVPEVVDRGLFVPGVGDAFDVATIWGPVWNTDSWPAVLTRASAIVLLLDPQVAQAEEGRKCVRVVASLTPAISGCVVWTKQDLVEDGAGRVSGSLLDETPLASWPIFHTRSDEPAGLVEPIEWTMERLKRTGK